MGAVQHPLAGPALEALVVGERDRVGRLVRVRELILVAQDALFLSVAVVTGLASAGVTKTAVVVAGLAGAVAGSLSEAAESLLAARAADELYNTEVASELVEIGARRDVEIDELAILLRREGLAADAAAGAAAHIATSPRALARAKIEKELGLAHRAGPAPRGDSIGGGLAYFAAALTPLWPFLVWRTSVALVMSLATAAAVVAVLVVAKARVVHVPPARNAAEAALCAIAAGAGYLIGWLGQAWSG